MRTINPLKIGKYTFWISFAIGNLFLLGFLFGMAIKNYGFASWSALFGSLYLFIATVINLILLLILLVWGIFEVEKRKQCFTGIGIIAFNIPLATLYVFVGTKLLMHFKICFC